MIGAYSVDSSQKCWGVLLTSGDEPSRVDTRGWRYAYGWKMAL